MEWFVVNTHPRQEALAEKSLTRLGVETFLPRIKQKKLIRRKRRTVISPLFPGYIFVRFNFNMDTRFRAVKYAHGTHDLVTFGDEPATVDETVIESIRSRLHDGCVVPQSPFFRKGQRVLIQGGPFEGFEAVFDREMSSQQRVVLLFQALTYQARLVVSMEHVVNL